VVYLWPSGWSLHWKSLGSELYWKWSGSAPLAFLSSDVTKPKQSLRNYVMSLGLLKWVMGRVEQTFHNVYERAKDLIVISFFPHGERAILTPACLSRNAISTNGPGKRSGISWTNSDNMGTRFLFVGIHVSRGTGLHPETIRRCSWTEMFAMRSV
jgi:hypothetical protein